MKKTLIGLAIVGLSCSAFANELYPLGVYVGAKAGGSIVHPEKITSGETSLDSYTKGAFVGGVQVGYDFSYDFDFPVRAELDYSMRSNAKKTNSDYTTKARADTLLANFYYDFYTGTGFTPYIDAGLGVGFDKIKVEGPASGKKNKTRFAWAAGLGSSYNFTDDFAVDLGARFYDAGKIKNDGDKPSARILGTDILLGVRYAF